MPGNDIAAIDLMKVSIGQSSCRKPCPDYLPVLSDWGTTVRWSFVFLKKLIQIPEEVDLGTCSLADSIGRSPGHNSVDHFQSDLISNCIDTILEKHSGTLFQCMKNRVEGRGKEVEIASGRCSNRRRWRRRQCAVLRIDISGNYFLFE